MVFAPDDLSVYVVLPDVPSKCNSNFTPEMYGPVGAVDGLVLQAPDVSVAVSVAPAAVIVYIL